MSEMTVGDVRKLIADIPDEWPLQLEVGNREGRAGADKATVGVLIEDNIVLSHEDIDALKADAPENWSDVKWEPNALLIAGH